MFFTWTIHKLTNNTHNLRDVRSGMTSRSIALQIFDIFLCYWVLDQDTSQDGDFGRLECPLVCNLAFLFLPTNPEHTFFGREICLASIEQLQCPRSTGVHQGSSFQTLLSNSLAAEKFPAYHFQ